MTPSLLAPAALIALAAVLAVSIVLMPLGLRRQRAQQRRIVPAGLVGGIDEVFHPEAHEALLVWEARVEAPAPVPAPGEPPFASGRITITLPLSGGSGAAEAPGSPRGSRS